MTDLLNDPMTWLRLGAAAFALACLLRIGRKVPSRAAVRAAVLAVASNTDTYIFGGIVFTGVGLALYFPGAGLAVAGVMTFAVGIWLSLPAAAPPGPSEES